MGRWSSIGAGLACVVAACAHASPPPSAASSPPLPSGRWYCAKESDDDDYEDGICGTDRVECNQLVSQALHVMPDLQLAECAPAAFVWCYSRLQADGSWDRDVHTCVPSRDACEHTRAQDPNAPEPACVEYRSER
jgi:hypothetical protein